MMLNWSVYLPISGVEVNGFALLLLGFAVGVIGGFFGVGGAFIVTPALNIFGFPMAYAIGTDMAHIAGKSIVSTIKHWKLRNVDARLGILMITGTIIGTELGARLVMWLEKTGSIGPVVRITYIILLFSLGAFMLFEYLEHSMGHESKALKDIGESRWANKIQQIKIPPVINLTLSGFSISLWAIIGVGILTGFVAGFLGVGGGFIRMPALMYLIGTPIKVAIGTDLFEIMLSGSYGAFSYALKGRVELFAAIIMLCGAAVGAQIGATATQYAKGLIIRFYFALTMLCTGISVIFKHCAEIYGSKYYLILNEWAMSVSGLSDAIELKQWLYNNKEAVNEWIIQQPQTVQDALAMEKAYSGYSAYLMLGSACALCAIIMLLLLRGVLKDRAEARYVEIEAPMKRRKIIIASLCSPAQMAALKQGAYLAKALADEVKLIACREKVREEDYVEEGKKIMDQYGVSFTLESSVGRPYKEILKKSTGAYLLVIGSRPINPLDPEFYIGDTATRIVRNMTTSTLVAKGREEIKKILLCIEMPHSKKTVNMTKDIALATGAEVELLHVVTIPVMYAIESSLPDSIPDHEFPKVAYKKEIELLTALKEELLQAGVKNVSFKLREGLVEEELIMESEDGNYDLIVIREGFLRIPLGLFIGRLSTNVATHSPHASVLIVKR